MTNWHTLIESENPLLGMRMAAGLYSLGWRCYLGWYELGLKRRFKAPCLVIGVGNLTVGGTGKTPFVIMLAELLTAQGMKVAVSCSGYGGKAWKETTLLEPNQKLPPEIIGEEPLLIRNALPDIPIVIGQKRVPAVKAAYERWKPDVIILDDGFQHLPLARDIDIVLMDANKPFGNGFTLPAGTLREPISGLHRASAIVLTSQQDCVSEPIIHSFNPKLPVFKAYRGVNQLWEARSGTVNELERLEESGIIAVSAIGDPSSFENTLKVLGANLLEVVRKRDHYAYTAADMSQIEAIAQRRNADAIVTTEKDYVKLQPFVLKAGIPIFILKVKMRLESESLFVDWLVNLIHAQKS